jgi:hypothetical protein
MRAVVLHIHPLQYVPRLCPPLSRYRQVPFGPLEGLHEQPGMGTEIKNFTLNPRI